MSGITTKKTSPAFRFRASALAVALACAPLLASAAGMGKLHVYSTLGQPLRAEIELAATPEELSGMSARLASPESYKQAGLDYASTLLGLRFAVDKRGDGRSVVRLSSDRPINDPFVDVLLELNWSTGRLVREYTFLLDPPEVSTKVTPTVSSPASSAATPAAAADNAEGSKAASVETSSKGRGDKLEKAAKSTATDKSTKAAKESKGKTAKAASSDTPPSVTFAGAEGGAAAVTATRPVKKGDTLAAIAEEVRPEGVSLEQMLVGLLRANPEAFDGGNMNRLRAGAIIGVPSPESLTAVPEDDARKVMRAQAQDWNAYRRKLAGVVADAPAREEGASQSATGKITPKVDEPARPAQSARDQVRVGKTEMSKDAAASKAEAAEDRIARDKALQEAQQRVSALEKNVSDLQKLLEMKNQGMADLQKQAAAKSAEAAAAAKPAEKPVEKPADKVPEKITDKAADKAADKPGETFPLDKAQDKAAAPAEGGDKVAAADAAKPVEASAEKPAAEPTPPAPAAPPPAPVAAPSFIDELLGNPLQLGGMAAALLAGIGGLVWARRRRQGAAEEDLVEGAEAVPLADAAAPAVAETVVAPPSQAPAVPASTASAEFSQAGPGAIDADDVDPVAEADVYIAYGRDEQAEEILLEARQRDPGRFSILAKLLEIYAKRGDLANYAAVAGNLRDLSGGEGEEWRQAAETGARIDPANPLYGAVVESTDVSEVLEMPDLDSLSATADLAEPTEPAAAVPEAPPAVDDLTSLDFELNLNDQQTSAGESADAPVDEPIEAAPEPLAELAAEPAPVDDTHSLDFDLDALQAPVAAEPAPESIPEPAPAPVDDSNALDFEFELPTPTAEVEPETPAVAADPVADGQGLDFDPAALGLTSAVSDEASNEAAPASEPAAAGSDDGGLDFSFDLDEPGAVDEPSAVPVAEPAVADPAVPLVDIDRLEPIPMSDELAADLARVQAMHEEAEAAAMPELPETAPVEERAEVVAEMETVDDPDFDLPELDLPAAEAESPAAVPEPLIPPFDMASINLDLASLPAEAEVETPAVVEAEAPVGELPVAEEAVPELPEVSEVDDAGALDELLASAAAEPAIDLSPAPGEGSVSDPLHSLATSVEAAEVDVSTFEHAADPLSSPPPESADAVAVVGEGQGGEGGAHWQEVETKLDLAKAYEEMGDLEGARELLSEVVAEGDAAQQSKARDMLERVLAQQ